LAALLVAGMAVLASAGPASAQAPLAAFSANCDSVAGVTPRTGGFVEVPSGTRINGGAPEPVARRVDTLNATAVFTNGTTATLNQVTIVGTTATRRAIVITAGPGAGQVVGQVICTATTSEAAALVGSAITVICPAPVGILPTQNSASGEATLNGVTVTGPAGARCTAAAGATTAEADGQFTIIGLIYPLAVDVAGASGATPDLASGPASTDGGPATGTLVIGGAVILAALAQFAVWRRRRDVTTG
jgi:hypothetical protein